MKNNSITLGRLWSISVVIMAMLLWLGSVYRVEATPPEPQPTPGLTLEPSVDIRTKLKPNQTSELTPFQFDGRQLWESSLPAEAQELPIGALDQQTFNAIADATVLQGAPTLNFGSTIDMWAGYDDSLNPDGMIARSLIRFYIGPLTPNQVITKATLRIRLVQSWDFPNTFRTITTYRITGDWSESSINWNNAPGYGSAYGSKSIRNDDFTWHEFDVTNLVASWYSGTSPNYGIMLRGPEIAGLDSSWRGFSTREGSFIPQLVVEYQAPSIKTFLPIILNAPSAPTPPTPGSKPIDGHWTGTTSRSQPMSFDVASGGTTWSNFTLRTTASVGGCTATVEVTVSPGTITNNQFSSGGGNFSFTGQFNSPTTASGTYSFVNYPGCGGFSQSGTWTANAP